jgi:predicted Zn-dependent protease
MGAEAIASWMDAVLAAARETGCPAAEVFVKEGRARQVTIDPSSGDAPGRQVSRTEEAGAALQVIDPAGRRGLAWANLGDAVDPAVLIDAALQSARLGPAAGTAWIATAAAGSGADLDLVDPACLQMGDEELIGRLREAAAEVARSGEAMVEVDRIVVSDAATTIRITTSGGMRASFDRTLAMLSIALVPAAPEARAVVEERVSCRLAYLDLVECAREAILRALPERGAGGGTATGDLPAGEAFKAGAVDLVLAPRAAASLVAALAPAVLSGSLPETRRPSALVLHDDPTVPGRPSSAPFDGAGRPTVRRILVEGGRPAGRPGAAGRHVERPSYRDLPRPAPAALVVAPSVTVGDPPPGGGSAAPGRVVVIRAAIVDIKPGAEWVVRIRRGDLWKGGEWLGTADGLVWEGDLARLVQAIVETGDDSRWYQCGATVSTPSLTLRGLTPWRRDAATGA